jgi:hypothetical protein
MRSSKTFRNMASIQKSVTSASACVMSSSGSGYLA